MEEKPIGKYLGNGKREGLWKDYGENGKLLSKEKYKNGELVERTYI